MRTPTPRGVTDGDAASYPEAKMHRFCVHIVAAPTWLEDLGFLLMAGMILVEQYRIVRLRATIEQIRGTRP